MILGPCPKPNQHGGGGGLSWQGQRLIVPFLLGIQKNASDWGDLGHRYLAAYNAWVVGSNIDRLPNRG